jgi:hypothetical protein
MIRELVQKFLQIFQREPEPTAGKPRILTDKEMAEARERLNKAYEEAKRQPKSGNTDKVSPKFIGNIGFPDD